MSETILQNATKNDDNLSCLIRAGKDWSDIIAFIDINPEAVKERTATDGGYPLHELFRVDRPNHRYDRVMMKLIEIFPNVALEMNTKGDYPLHLACCSKNATLEIINKLVEIFPEAVKEKNDDDEYPLHKACQHGISEEVIIKLLELFPNAAQEKNTKGDYPLHIVCRKGSGYVLGQLTRVIMKLLEIFPEAAKVKNKKDEYPLHVACDHLKSDAVIMKLLEVYPQAAKEKNNMDQYPLYLACRFPSPASPHHGKSVEVIQKILELYPLALQEKEASDGMYPIHCARSLAVAKLFVTTDPSVLQQRNNDRRNAFHFACYFGHIPVVRYFLKFPGVDVNTKDSDGNTPLYYACLREHTEVVQILLQKPGIDVNAVCKFGFTILHHACRERSIEIVEMLLEHPRILINENVNYNNITPLDVVNNQLKDLPWKGTLKQSLRKPLLMQIKTLLEDFPVKRKWQAFHYMLNNENEWAVFKKVKTS